MATFYNKATLSYNGSTTTSNVTMGEIIEVLSASKTAVMERYTEEDEITYVINIVNSGSTAFTNLTISDDLGAYTCGTGTAVPLNYVSGSIRYFLDGVLQTAPTVTEGPPLVISGISVPANGLATIVYNAVTNQYAPLGIEDSITNTATITGGGICDEITVSETVFSSPLARLTINKSVCPTVITECGRITYTFVVQNTGNAAADASYNAIISDTFDPVLTDISVTFNGTAWTAGTNYTYDETTGEFETVAGQVTVPAATYTTDETTCAVTIEPGVSTLTISGTIGCCG